MQDMIDTSFGAFLLANFRRVLLQGVLMILWSSGCCMSISRQLHTMIGFADRLSRAFSMAPPPMRPISLVMKRHMSAVLLK